MKILSIIAAVSILAFTLGCENMGTSTGSVTLDSDIDSVSYSLGINVARNVKSQGLEEINAAAVAQAFKDVFEGDTVLISDANANKALNDYFQKMQKLKADAAKQAGREFLEENKTKEGVVVLPSGLQYQVLTEGTGEKPALENKIKAHYHGTTIDGTVFDSSVDRGEPVTFPVDGVIAGWTEALQLMPVGSKWKLFVPSDLAYGARGAGGNIGPHETLIFEVELLSIEE